MAKLTFVIQAPISESQVHRHLQDILKEINASSEYQLERLVFMGSAAVFAANEDLVGKLLLNLGGRHYPFVSSAPYAEEEEEEEHRNKAGVVSSLGAEEGSAKDDAAEEDEDEFDDFKLDEDELDSDDLDEDDDFDDEDEDDFDDDFDDDDDDFDDEDEDDDFDDEDDDFDDVFDDDDDDYDDEVVNSDLQALASFLSSLSPNEVELFAEAFCHSALPDFVQKQKLINQSVRVFNTLLDDYHKIISQSNCEVRVHDVAAQHYQLTPQTIHTGWSFVDTKGLLDIIKSEHESVVGDNEQHLVFVWSGLGNEAYDLDELMEAYAEKIAAATKKSQAQPDSALSQHKDSLKGGHKKCAPKASALQPQESLSPELLVFFDFPRIAVDILSPSLAATDDKVRNDFGLSCNDESWWRVVYGLNLIQEMVRAKFRVKACMSVDVLDKFGDVSAEIAEISIPAPVRKLLVKTANKGVPFYYLDNGYTSFAAVMKHEVLSLMMTPAPEDTTLGKIYDDYAPLMLF